MTVSLKVYMTEQSHGKKGSLRSKLFGIFRIDREKATQLRLNEGFAYKPQVLFSNLVK